MTTDFLGALAAASLSQMPGVRPRLATRFERSPAMPSLETPTRMAGSTPPEPETQDSSSQAVGLEPPPARPVTSVGRHALSSAGPPGPIPPATSSPAALPGALPAPRSEAPGPGRRQPAPIPPSAAPQAQPPVTQGLAAPPSAAQPPPEREQLAPAATTKPPRMRPTAARAETRPSAGLPEPTPVQADPATFFIQPPRGVQPQARRPAQPDTQVGPVPEGQQPAGLAPAIAAAPAPQGGQLLAPSAAPAFRVKARPWIDQPALLPIDPALRPAPAREPAPDSEQGQLPPGKDRGPTAAVQDLARQAVTLPAQVRSQAANASEVGAGPAIRVTIGRIEVHATVPPAPEPQAPPVRRQPPLPLDAYLKQRSQGHGDRP